MKQQTSSAQRILQFIRKVIISGCWLFVTGLVVWNILRFYPGDRLLPVRLGNFFAPWLFLILLPVAAIAALGRQRWLISLTSLLILLFGVRFGYLWKPYSASASVTTTTELKVMTYNVNSQNYDGAQIAEVILAEQPDIVALQELRRETRRHLINQVETDYPYMSMGSVGYSSQLLLSRYPISEDPTEPEARFRRIDRAIVETPSGPVKIWHIDAGVGLRQGQWEWQHFIFDTASKEIAEENRPIIVLGDFNTTDQTENYRLVADQLIDVHQAVGRGFGFTFPHSGDYPLSEIITSPFLRIDMILVSQQFTPQTVRVLPETGGSDHRPVVTTLKLVSDPN